MTQQLQELGQPLDWRSRSLDEKGHVPQRLVKVLRPGLGSETEIGDPGQRRRNLDRHLAEMGGAGSHSGTGTLHAVLTHERRLRGSPKSTVTPHTTTPLP